MEPQRLIIVPADEPPTNTPKGFTIREIRSGSPEDLEDRKRYQPERQRARDLTEAPYRAPDSIGYGTIPVLPQLWGRPYDNMAVNALAAVRPSRVQVGPTFTCESCPWKVYILLEADGVTIKSIHQSVQFGLEGCHLGGDVQNYLDGREGPCWRVGAVFNPRGRVKAEPPP